MKNSKRIVCALILTAFAVIGVDAQTQPRLRRASDRQVSNALRRLQQSSARFRDSLSTSLNQSRIDVGRGKSEINSFQRNFENAITQFRDSYDRRSATAADVRNILRNTAPINDFVNGNRVGSQVQNDWAAVLTELNALATAYSVRWQWNRLTLPPVSSGQSYRLSDTILDQLIQRIENGGDALRSSLTDGFDRTPYDRTRSEGSMNDAVRSFKKATDQLRIQFDIGQLGVGDVERLISRATPLESFMRNNQVTDRVRSDWSTLRGNLTILANAYNVDTSWETQHLPKLGTAKIIG